MWFVCVLCMVRVNVLSQFWGMRSPAARLFLGSSSWDRRARKKSAKLTHFIRNPFQWQKPPPPPRQNKNKKQNLQTAPWVQLWEQSPPALSTLHILLCSTERKQMNFMSILEGNFQTMEERRERERWGCPKKRGLLSVLSESSMLWEGWQESQEWLWTPVPAGRCQLTLFIHGPFAFN